MRRQFFEVARLNKRAVGVNLPPIGLVAAFFEQRVVDTEGARFGDAPAMHLLAADTILEARFALEDEHAMAALGHVLGKRRSGQTTTNDDQVVGHLTSQSP